MRFIEVSRRERFGCGGERALAKLLDRGGGFLQTTQTKLRKEIIMAKYEMRGGGTVSGDNVCEVVAIEASSFNPEADTGAFVRVLAARCKTYDDSEIRTDTPENTVADLIKSGFLTPCNSLQE